MRCTTHLLRDAVGYCQVCGSLGCSDCLTEHKGAFYCKRDYKPIHEKLEEEKKHQERLHRPERQRLVIHLKDGRIEYGACFAMNLEADGFKCDLLDKTGHPVNKTEKINFKDLKAVFYVKDFEGKPDKHAQLKEWHPLGGEMVVEFQDGECIRGHCLHVYRSDTPRFYLIPDDPDSNNVNILVERSATTGVYTVEEYKEKHKKEVRLYLSTHQNPEKHEDELMGDFYFDKRQYRKALSCYDKAFQTGFYSTTLAKKMVTCEYNVAMIYVREKHYHRALKHLERANELEPGNDRVNSKIGQIRTVLSK